MKERQVRRNQVPFWWVVALPHALKMLLGHRIKTNGKNSAHRISLCMKTYQSGTLSIPVDREPETPAAHPGILVLHGSIGAGAYWMGRFAPTLRAEYNPGVPVGFDGDGQSSHSALSPSTPATARRSGSPVPCSQ